MILVIQAHPYPDRSRANRALGSAIAGMPGVEIRSLYDRYPDFAIDVADEQRALTECSVVVWQHPLYWYTVPALLKLWFEKVLALGWAYGPGGRALTGKRCLWVTTTGADETGYSSEGVHEHPFEVFVPVVRQTARFCGMEWLDPLIFHGAHRLEPDDLAAAGTRYRARLEALLAEDARKDEGATDA
ncbi:Glutathione-regulated potassium-efflux system ancillary protein KefF [Minicystis rosea]|nr:Glutathione-regulated potassium-efflux system ancillary protein KefF [Minicystis rosea]